MGATQRIMGACGCGDEEKRQEDAAKKPWFRGTPADVKKAKEAGAVVVSGPCAETAQPVDCPTKVKDGDKVFIQGCPKELEKVGVKAPKEADATETAALEKKNPASEEAAPAPEAEAAKPEAEAAKPEEVAKPEEAAKPAEATQ